MADRAKYERDEEEFFRKSENFAQQLSASHHYYTQGDKFNTEYSSLVNEFSRKLGDTKAYFANQHAQIAEQEREARRKAEEDEEFVRNIERNITEKTAEIETKKLVYEQNKAKLAEELKALDAKKLGKFKVKDQIQLQAFFSGIHNVFYAGEGDFDWAKFKAAFEKDKTANLQARLGNPNFASFNQAKIDTLARLRNDPFYSELANKPKEGAGLLPLVNYLNYAVPAINAYVEFTNLERDIANIRLEGPAREESARTQHSLAKELQASLQYLNALNERFVNNLEPFKNEGSRKADFEEAFSRHLRNRQEQLDNYARVIASTR